MIGAAAPKVVFHYLSLLFHPIRPEWLTEGHPVMVRIGADTECSVEQMPQLSGNTAREVHHRPPHLILTAVGQLMSEHRQVSMTPVGEKDMVAKRDSSIPAGPQYQTTQTARHTRAFSLVY